MDKSLVKVIVNVLTDELPDIMPPGVPRCIKVVFDYSSFEMSVKKEAVEIERYIAEQNRYFTAL